MAEYSKIAEGTFTVTSGGTAQFVSLPFVPNTFETWNKSVWGEAPAGAATVQYAIGFAEDAAGTYYGNSAVASSSDAALKNVTAASGGFSFIDAGTYQYGPQLTISGIVNSTGVVTTTADHHLAVGDVVLLTGTTGMYQIGGIFTQVTAVGSSTTFTIGYVPTSGFAANATAGFAKKLLYKDLYVPYGCMITAINTSTSVITTSVDHQFKVGQEVAFVIPQVSASVWGTTELDSQVVLQATGVPQQAYVTAVTANTLTVDVDMTGFTAFAFPTSAQAQLGLTFPQVLAIGDANTGYSGPVVPQPQTIPGAFAANTRRGVIVGSAIAANTSDEIRWRAVYPDMIQDL